jgi:hypothetical protein
VEAWIIVSVSFMVVILFMLVSGWFVLLEVRSLCRLLKFKQEIPLLEHKKPERPDPASLRREANRRKSSERMKAFWANVKKGQGD